MKCSVCSLENPPLAQRCDCGYPLAGSAPFVQVTPPIVNTNGGMIRFVWVAPLLGALAAGADLLASWDSAKSAPQQAALAGFVLACAVIPYCFARAVVGLAGKS
jgi:hypothetical protein